MKIFPYTEISCRVERQEDVDTVVPYYTRSFPHIPTFLTIINIEITMYHNNKQN